MKSLIHLVAAAAALSVSVASFAQTDAPVTRAQVRAELYRLEQAGYHPSAAEPYPAELDAAEARVSAQDPSGIGSNAAPVVQAGRTAVTTTYTQDLPASGQ
ncbi:DUF4148 domain-containing protein [Burkholderia sp. MR1-5-21]